MRQLCVAGSCCCSCSGSLTITRLGFRCFDVVDCGLWSLSTHGHFIVYDYNYVLVISLQAL